MILKSLLNLMDDSCEIEVVDIDGPINEWLLFRGDVFDCKKQKGFKNGIIEAIATCDNYISVAVDISYQKQKGRERMRRRDARMVSAREVLFLPRKRQ